MVPEVRGWPELEIGFKSAEVVVFPVSRHVLVYGANCRVKATNTTRKRIAAHNTFTMRTADEQVYSHVPDFCWLDDTGAYQSNWKLFSKEKFMQGSSAETEKTLTHRTRFMDRIKLPKNR